MEAGANVNSAGPKDNTALHLAAGKGMNTAVKTLVAAGADVNAPGQLRERPLHTVRHFFFVLSYKTSVYSQQHCTPCRNRRLTAEPLRPHLWEDGAIALRTKENPCSDTDVFYQRSRPSPIRVP